MSIRNLDGSTVTFKQDEQNLHFDEATHTYSVEGYGVLTPVSNVISKFFKPFDATAISLRKCFGDEMAAAKLREEWASCGSLAAQTGTHLHAQIENYINNGTAPQMECRVKYDGEYVHRDETVDISKEWRLFKAFDNETDYHPFRTEWRVFDLEAGIAGTIDLLCSCDDGTYEIFDWKRSKRIDPHEVNKYANGINGLEHMTDTSYSHYCLQQNLYRYILEQRYGLSVSRMHLVVLHPELYRYNVVAVPRLDDEVMTIISRFQSL